MKQFGIGQPVRRVEDRRFITGHGNYLDDISRPRQAYAFMLRSPHAHARITAIKTAAATSAPGVFAVYTGEDLVRDGLGTIPCLSAVNNRDQSRSAMPPHPAKWKIRSSPNPKSRSWATPPLATHPRHLALATQITAAFTRIVAIPAPGLPTQPRPDDRRTEYTKPVASFDG